MGIVAQLPDLSAVMQLAGVAQSGLDGVAGGLDRLARTDQGPLQTIARSLTDLQRRLDVDTSGLTNRLPAALTTIQNAVPAGGVDSVRRISETYAAARTFLADGALTREASAAGSLLDAGRRTLTGAVEQFRNRQTELATRIIDGSIVSRVRSDLQTLTALRTDFGANQSQLLPFLANQLVGVAPSVLEPSIAHVRATLAVLDPLDDPALTDAVRATRGAMDDALRQVLEAIVSLDPADAAAHAALRTRLDTLDTTATAAGEAVAAVSRSLATLIGNHAWDDVFNGLETMLSGLALVPRLSIDAIVDDMSSVLHEVVMRVQTMASPEDLAERIEALSGKLRDTFLDSPLGQVRTAIETFLGDVRRALQDIPVDRVQQAVDAMLARVRQEIEGLGLTRVGDEIDAALADAERFVTQRLNADVREQVRAAVRALLEQLGNVRLDGLVDAIASLVSSLEQLIGEFVGAVDRAVQELGVFLAELEQVSFRPAADAVIAEIDDIKARLQAMNPDALSDVERLALQGALAVLRAIDLETEIVAGLKTAFAAAGREFRRLLDELGMLLETLRQHLSAYDPRLILSALTDVLGRAAAAAQQLNGGLLVRPLQEQLDAAIGQLQTLSPGAILDPLQQPYRVATGAVRALDPAEWLEPLSEIYAAVDRLIGLIDITPLLEELDIRRRELLSDVRAALLNAIDGIDLPPPLNGFVDTLRPFVEAMSDALFTSPEERLPQIALDLRSRVGLADLFAPLDRLFDELIEMVRRVPEEPLVTAFNAIREGLGAGLVAIDPTRILVQLRQAAGRIAELAPDATIRIADPLHAGLIEYNLRVEQAPDDVGGAVAATRQRIETLIARFSSDAGPMSAWRRHHDAAGDALRRHVNSLASGPAEAAYGKVRTNLEATLPRFLQVTTPLTHDDILAGLEEMRPSHAGASLEGLIAEFLQQLQPMAAAIEAPVNGFFRSVQGVLQLLDPLSLRTGVAAIYTAVRERVRILDPTALAARIRADLLQPVLDMLGGLDPEALKARLEATFRRVVEAVSRTARGVLEDIAAAIDAELRQIREALTEFSRRLTTAFEDAVNRVRVVIQTVEQLLFVELVDRLRSLIDNLEASFARELDRVRVSFDQMLDAMPGGSGSVTVG
jgi:hypothetical protein